MSDQTGLIDEKSLHVGAEVYIFDENHRVYERDEANRSIGGAIYREFFRKVKITSETPRKWNTSWNSAFKKNPYETGFLTEAMIEERVWRHEHRCKIVRAVDQASIAQLRQIAQILGYTA